MANVLVFIQDVIAAKASNFSRYKECKKCEKLRSLFHLISHLVSRSTVSFVMRILWAVDGVRIGAILICGGLY